MTRRSSGGRVQRSTRRGNAHRRDLTNAKIVSAGLEIFDRYGIEAVTMRGVAAALGVSPMALYNHVGGKDDLLRHIAASIVDAAEFDGRKRDWRAQIEHCFDTFRSICLQHPALPALLEQADIAPTSVFAPMEVTVAALRRAGPGSATSTRCEPISHL